MKQRRCIECGKALNHLTRGRWGPDHWCNDCDTKRVERISRQLEAMCNRPMTRVQEAKP